MSTFTSTVKKAVKKLVEPSEMARTTDASLKELFIDCLREVYWGEKHLVKVLPELQEAASSVPLKKALEAHLEQTRSHASRLEDILGQLGRAPRGKRCEALVGLQEDAEMILEDTEDGSATRDVAIIMAAQKVEHFEIATYGSLVQLAKTLGYDEIATTLAATLSEEKETDMKLTEIAEQDVNYQSAEEGVEANLE